MTHTRSSVLQISSALRGTFALAALLASAACLLAATPRQAAAELAAAGPTLQLGYADDADKHGNKQDLVNLTLGWRFRFEDPKASADFFDKAGLDLSWVVEPSVGLFEGDRSAMEASVVPMFHFEPSAAQRWFPYLEGGIGLIYNDLRGYDLGSRILFSDQGTVGLYYRTEDDHRWGIGYRFRHISHAKMWAEANAGLNTHFLVFSYE